MYTIDENTTYIEERSGGEPHKFYLLSPYERFEIVASLRKRRKDALIANLEAAALSSEQKFSELEAFEDGWDGEAEFVRFVNSAAGDTEIPERALRTEADAARKIVAGLHIPRHRMLAFKAALTGLQLVTQSAEGKPESPDPQAPPTVYGQPAAAETGSTTSA